MPAKKMRTMRRSLTIMLTRTGSTTRATPSPGRRGSAQRHPCDTAAHLVGWSYLKIQHCVVHARSFPLDGTDSRECSQHSPASPIVSHNVKKKPAIRGLQAFCYGIVTDYPSSVTDTDVSK